MSKDRTSKLVIITRTKDRPIFLERAIKSVANQTRKDFVHVIVNDAGNKDDVDKVVANHSKPDYKTVVIHNSESNGMEAASNKGIAAVESDYIAIHDDDDTWHPEFVERVLNQFDAEGSKGVVVRTNKVTEELTDKGLIKTLKTTQWMPDMEAINLYRQFIENQMTPITFVFRRDVYVDLGRFDESLPVMGDWDFGIRYLIKHDVDYLDPGFALANYHHRKLKPGKQGNTSYAGNNLKTTVGNQLMNKYLREELKSGKIGPGYIMSKTKYEQNFALKQLTRFLPGRLSKKVHHRYKK